MGIEKDIPAHH